jgi:phosphomevalonate kinase
MTGITILDQIPLLRDRDPAAVPGVTLIETQLESLRLTAEEIRAGMRKMGELAGGIPIEPNEQTKLVDACLALPGVICGGVPGGECLLCA